MTPSSLRLRAAGSSAASSVHARHGAETAPAEPDRPSPARSVAAYAAAAALAATTTLDPEIAAAAALLTLLQQGPAVCETISQTALSIAAMLCGAEKLIARFDEREAERFQNTLRQVNATESDAVRRQLIAQYALNVRGSLAALQRALGNDPQVAGELNHRLLIGGNQVRDLRYNYLDPTQGSSFRQLTAGEEEFKNRLAILHDDLSNYTPVHQCMAVKNFVNELSPLLLCADRLRKYRLLPAAGDELLARWQHCLKQLKSTINEELLSPEALMRAQTLDLDESVPPHRRDDRVLALAQERAPSVAAQLALLDQVYRMEYIVALARKAPTSPEKLNYLELELGRLRATLSKSDHSLRVAARSVYIDILCEQIEHTCQSISMMRNEDGLLPAWCRKVLLEPLDARLELLRQEDAVGSGR